MRCREGNGHARDHLLEALEGGLDIVAGGDIVLDLVDKGRVGNAARVGGSIFAAEGDDECMASQG